MVLRNRRQVQYTLFYLLLCFCIWGLHAKHNILGRVIHAIRNGLVSSQFFIPSRKELYLLGFKGGPASFIYHSTPASFHPLSPAILSIYQRAAAACVEVLTPTPALPGASAAASPARRHQIPRGGGTEKGATTGMDRLFLAAWVQGIKMCNISPSAAFPCQPLSFKTPWSWACVWITQIGLIAKAGSPNAFRMFWI